MSWRREVATQFEKRARLISAEDFRMSADGHMEILGWQGDPELTAECSPAGDLRLRVPAFQILQLRRRWDDPDREPDEDPHEELAAMFKRLSRGLSAWGDLVHQLAG